MVNCGDVVLPYQPTSRKERRRRICRFCSIAMGSASELEYHLLLAQDLKMIKPKDHAELSQHAIELKRMLTALLQKLKADR
ncbi:MAG TPA: four helix bundle protein [Bryobacteraceae bacterium]